MEVGNIIHQGGDLLTSEAIELLSNTADVILKEEHNSLEATFSELLTSLITELRREESIVIVCGGKSYGVCCRNQRCYFFDSHRHGDFGALIMYGPLKEFVHNLKHYVSMNKTEHIYVAIVKFLH